MFVVTENKGYHVRFANGWSVSVQWGRGNYGSNRDYPGPYGGPVPGAAHVETAVVSPTGVFVKRRRGDSDTVQGYQTPEQVAATMVWASRKKAAQS